MRTAVVTGGSSGLGLEFVRRLLRGGARVVAGSRRAESSEALARLKSEHEDRLTVHRLDVGDRDSREAFGRRVSETLERLDVLVNAAGIIAGDEERISVFGALDQEELARTFLINSIAPLMMTELLHPLLERGEHPIVVNISSLNGSIASWDRPGKYSYCASKAALNMITKTLSVELKDAGIRVVAFHPGWVKTWMTRDEPAPMEPEESVAGMLRVMDSLTLDGSGRFLDWRGREVPW
ncbi:MAG: SDR family oxidoreductase [Candidatus Bipolaricaulota bacterium]|nr:MAG: SDR family oxidoreductase [Candidatus Bipolaricaulota bacterium]